MSLNRICIAPLPLVLLLAAQPAVAAVPQTIAFQGFLADEDGAPLDGTVNLQLSLYDVPSGGTALWTETQTSVVVSAGVFSVALGAVTPFPDALFVAAPRHLGVRVNGEAELPRTLLHSSPFAFRAQSADTLSRAIQLRTPFGTEVLRSEDSSNGRLLVFGNLFNGEALRIGSEFDGGGLLVMRDGNSQTVRLDGNALGGSQLTLSGLASTVVLSTTVSGDLSVQLPSSSIAAPEVRDEPGLASNRNTGFTALTSTPSSVLSRSITPPADGHILALGQCVARITHTQGTTTSGAAGLSDDGVNFGTAQDVNVILSGNTPSGSFGIPLHVNAVFDATAGVARTIHLLGSEATGDIELEDVSLTLLYVPTAYGTVSESLAAADGGEQGGARGPQTAAEIDAEKSESRRANDDRIASELAAMAVRQAELAAHQAAMEQELAAMRAELEAAGSRR